MRGLAKINWIISAHAVLILILPLIAIADGDLLEKLQFDLQGDIHYSRYNFTDAKESYDGIDGWAELKAAFWIDKNKGFSPYLSIIPSFTSESEFWWQRNFQLCVGLQWYPVETFISISKDNDKNQYQFIRSIRMYVLTSWREYYDEPEGADPEDTDFQVGVDYYYDNLNNHICENNFIVVAWSNAGFRKTNFSFDNYDTFLWAGNIKIGPKFKPANTLLLPYIVTDWTYVPRYSERWWENFLRIGAGVRYYPLFSKAKGGSRFKENIFKRFHIYVEGLHNFTWFGDNPGDYVEENDFRIGLGFSTFFEKRKR